MTETLPKNIQVGDVGLISLSTVTYDKKIFQSLHSYLGDQEGWMSSYLSKISVTIERTVNRV